MINQIAYALIACGAVTFFLSFLGYCGAIRESTCLLYTVRFLVGPRYSLSKPPGLGLVYQWDIGPFSVVYWKTVMFGS